MKKNTIKCTCGLLLSPHVWKKHLLGAHCSATLYEKKRILKILDIKTVNAIGWKKSEGIEALLDSGWYLSVIHKDTTLEDWSFNSPRKEGVCRPSILNKFSESRKGTGNPALKVLQFSYNLKTLNENFDIELLDFLKNDCGISEFKRSIENKFPKFMYLLSGKYPGSTFSDFVAWKIGISRGQLLELLQKKRGKKISIGQRQSDKCIQAARESGARLIESDRRVSNPQKILYEMILKVDPSATLEKCYRMQNRWISYDIFSPELDACIEMHGDIWHKLGVGKSGLTQLVQKNIENDKQKQDFAEKLGLKYLVFWQSEHEQWQKKIESIYGKSTITVKEAKNSVDQKTGKKTRL